MDVRQLRYFVAIAETGNILKAAALLGLTQPALSRQVRHLEAEIGTTLLVRNSRGVTITESGEQLLEHAKSIIAGVDKARAEVIAAKGVPTGQISFGVTPTVGARLVSELVRRFSSLYPGVFVRVVEGLSGNVHEWLVQNRIDVGIIYSAPRSSNLIAEPLLLEDLFLVGPIRDPRRPPIGASIEDLEKVPLILPSSAHGLRSIVNEVATKHGIKLNVSMEVDSLPAIKELVESGVGYSVLPYSPIEREIDAGRLSATRFTDPPIVRTLVLATPATRTLSRAGRELARQVRLIAHDLVREGRWPARIHTS